MGKTKEIKELVENCDRIRIYGYEENKTISTTYVRRYSDRYNVKLHYWNELQEDEFYNNVDINFVIKFILEDDTVTEIDGKNLYSLIGEY